MGTIDTAVADTAVAGIVVWGTACKGVVLAPVAHSLDSSVALEVALEWVVPHRASYDAVPLQSQ